ncbi:FIG00605059: hypothetical protein [Olavius algarvensis associated proteobacterium Delta 3]|nr:FIG00605059: hypothetical protein [Olavius algarvensis associated proteobacterium Delta 3]CAB5155376.1 FIG00605059: hypothetical protein [Olavius algarvensis associated proteobacterium Delta 3]
MTRAKFFRKTFTPDALGKLFPKDRADRFFEALLGDAQEGAYDIRLVFKDAGNNRLDFEFHLTPRPGRCLRCNLTYGLPDVFSRHPVIDIQGLVGAIDHLMDGNGRCSGWSVGRVREVRSDLHCIPLTIAYV